MLVLNNENMNTVPGHANEVGFDDTRAQLGAGDVQEAIEKVADATKEVSASLSELAKVPKYGDSLHVNLSEATLTSGYTFPADGMVVMRGAPYNGSSCIYTVDNLGIFRIVNGTSSGYIQLESSFFVHKGQVLKYAKVGTCEAAAATFIYKKQ